MLAQASGYLLEDSRELGSAVLYNPKAVNCLSQQFSKFKSVKSIMYERYLLTAFVGPGVGAGVGGFEGAGVDCIIKKQSII